MPRPELVIALVGGAGTRLEDLSTEIKRTLDQFGYWPIDIRLSELLKRFSGWVDEPAGEYERIKHFQEMGNRFRQKLEDGAALARASLVRIREERNSKTGSPDKPIDGCAFVLRQLKHPAEADLLREVYGSAFLLVGAHAPSTKRREKMARDLSRFAGHARVEAEEIGNAADLISADDKQNDQLGQNTRDTFPKADFFANLGVEGGERYVDRFIELVFGHPFSTPSPDEYAMYQAAAASLRSSDDNRQVGAAIINIKKGASGKTNNADVIAVGMNEVPRGGGGLYWDSDSPDCRDQALQSYKNEDRAKEIKVSTLAELVERMRSEKLLSDAANEINSLNIATNLLPAIAGTQFMDIAEFSRPVHAEMAALIDAARRGVAVDGKDMYVTTFPCHNCAKHIIAAGISRVVYLEPYPKSRAEVLHGEEIELESLDGNPQPGKLVFSAYSGVAPRQYGVLFAMAERGAKKGLSLKDWKDNKKTLEPKYIPPNASIAAVQSERDELAKLPSDVFAWEDKEICP